MKINWLQLEVYFLTNFSIDSQEFWNLLPVHLLKILNSMSVEGLPFRRDDLENLEAIMRVIDGGTN